MMVPFGEWMPDQGDLNNPGVPTALNVLPHGMGYAPFPSQQVYSTALTARCQGAYTATAADGITYTYAGDATTLYVLADNAWTVVTRLDGAGPALDNYATASTQRWEWTKWSEDIIATNYADEVQVITMGGANFDDLTGSPPIAKYVTTSRNFVFLGNCMDGGTAVPNRVYWSAINDPTDWTPAAATQCDYQDLESGGDIVQIYGGEYVVVMCQRGIYRLDYVGSPIIWEVDEITPNVGLLCPGMSAQIGDTIYFLSPRGFYALRGGAELTPIGANKVDKYVLDDVDTGFLGECMAVADTKAHRVYFAYPGAGNAAGAANKVVVYDETLNKWSFANMDVQALFVGATSSYTMDGLDSINASLDAINISLDDDVWKGGRTQVATFDSSNQLALLTGTPLTAELWTPELQLSPGMRTMMTAVTPLVDRSSDGAPTVTVRVDSRDTRTTNQTLGDAGRTVNARGRVNLRKNARYHQLRVTVAGEWEYAQGIDIEAVAAGWR